MKINFDEDVRQFASIFKNNGFEIYAVGGVVRDMIMGMHPSDIDFCTNALPSDMLKIFPHSIKTGIKHGTLTIPYKKKFYEVTTYRIDGKYKDNRHPENISFSSSLKEDLSRRDFTINAMACDVETGKVIDLFHGHKDIKHKKIKTVGNSKKRFTEDALRMLRCIRFSSQLDFNISFKAFFAIKLLHKNILNISKERIREEFFKSITSKYRERALPLLYKTELLPFVIPSITKKLKKKDFKNFYSNLFTRNIEATLCYIFIKLNLSVEDLKNTNIYLKNSNRSSSLSEHLFNSYIYFNKFCISKNSKKFIDDYTKRKFLSYLKNENIDLFFDSFYPKLKNDYLKFVNDPLSLSSLNINGNDLIDIGFYGKNIKNVLIVLLDNVLKDPSLNRNDILKKLALSYFEKL